VKLLGGCEALMLLLAGFVSHTACKACSIASLTSGHCSNVRTVSSSKKVRVVGSIMRLVKICVCFCCLKHLVSLKFNYLTG
jgi:hypothetical protein